MQNMKRERPQRKLILDNTSARPQRQLSLDNMSATHFPRLGPSMLQGASKHLCAFIPDDDRM